VLIRYSDWGKTFFSLAIDAHVRSVAEFQFSFVTLLLKVT